MDDVSDAEADRPEAYARSLVEEIVSAETRLLRGGGHRRYRSVCGSSLGGVVSFSSAWEHGDVFGSAICMSSTFSHRDNLIDRRLYVPIQFFNGIVARASRAVHPELRGG